MIIKQPTRPPLVRARSSAVRRATADETVKSTADTMLMNGPVGRDPSAGSCGGTINRITQSANAITMEYGASPGLTRTVHMNMTAHPANVAPSRAGHSIGRWDGDTLVVDTVGDAGADDHPATGDRQDDDRRPDAPAWSSTAGCGTRPRCAARSRMRSHARST